MLELTRIVKRYPGAERNAVNNISCRYNVEFFGLLALMEQGNHPDRYNIDIDASHKRGSALDGHSV